MQDSPRKPPPTFVQVFRREPNDGRDYGGPNVVDPAERLVYDPHGAPDPIRQSAYWNVGKAPGEMWSHVPVALHLNIRNIHAVMRDDFAAGKVRAQFLTLMRNGMGGQSPWTERPNIDRGDSAPYGNMTGVQGPPQPAYSTPGMVSANGLVYTRKRAM
jgi:hypothetical protein